MCEWQRIWRECANEQIRLILRWLHICDKYQPLMYWPVCHSMRYYTYKLLTCDQVLRAQIQNQIVVYNVIHKTYNRFFLVAYCPTP